MESIQLITIFIPIVILSLYTFIKSTLAKIILPILTLSLSTTLIWLVFSTMSQVDNNILFNIEGN